ncbi:liprin-beta-1 isoform X3 [Harmonia axyridis]|uniref:liprin-beta-1 isoform X3 n=1 Tax=Harmonia axyridis TaxID=115357 RepID=UPI001E277CB1|nr:liprin-beta-1 isoform X3 [Harmonia axyridis]
MRELKCKLGTGNAVAAVVAVLEKQSKIYDAETSRGNFQERTSSSGNCHAVRDEIATQSASKNNLESIFDAVYGGGVSSKEDESFRTAVEDFDCVAEDVRRNFVKTDSLRRRRRTDTDVSESGDVDGGAFRIERTHSLKSIRTNPYVHGQDYTRSLGRREVRRTDHQDSTISVYTAQPFSNTWKPSPIAGHGSRLPPMPTRPEQRNTSLQTCNLTSQGFDGDTNIDGESGSYHLRQHEDADYRRLSGTESSTTDGLTSSSSSTVDSSDSDEESDRVMVKGLETIAEEDRITPSSLRSSRKDPGDNESSSSEDAAARKDRTLGWSEEASTAGSTSDLSSLEGRKTLRDSSTRCNSDFQWIAKEAPKEDLELPNMEVQTSPPSTFTKPPINRNTTREKSHRKDKAPGSLDRRRHHGTNRQERDQKSRSTHLKSPCRSEEFQPCQSYCCVPAEGFGFDPFHRRHERSDPQKYGSNPMLLEQRGSHPDIYGDMNRCRHDVMGCCSYHMAPPPCYFYGDRGYRWTPPPYTKPGEQDEKVRKLQFEKDNLHLQVQVLTDQIEAQSYKISDLEKTLQDKKHCLVEAEEKLQREMLSRSSLETQKLELMSIISDLKLQQAAAERENMELRNNLHMNNNGDLKKPTLLPRNSPQPHSALTPIQHTNSGQGNTLRVSPSPSSITSLNSTRRSETNYCLQDLQPPKTPPSSYKRQIDIHYASLPRQQFLSNGGNISSVDFNANPASNGSKKAVAFAQTEKGTTEENNGDASQLQIGKNKGIKKIFGKIKRSGSGNLEDLPGVGEFQRGGVRATAAARLGWSEPQLTQKPDKPFSEWDTENICDWLQDLGLDQYIPEARKWVKNGQQLQECAIAEIEKELIIKNPLHKKKLQLALIDAEENGSSDPYLSKAGELDTAWVLRWLDDVGLPQHKESFLINRVDGRVLHRLTVDDLGVLHVTSLLHVASIKRGIQVLRENDYSAACLKRRSVPDEGPPTPNLVSLWTTHRVMEWLRAVDLAEYAPNLRGAGVHGGLMVHETKFTAELLASLLSIPPGKTLLRRHLNTHFKELLGRDIIQEKRDAQSTMGYIPLTPTAKLKTTKKSQFSLKRKKSKGEADYGDLVCPLNPEKSGEMNGSALNSSMGQMRRINQEEEDVYHLADKGAKSLPASVTNSPIPFRNVKQ